MWTVNFQMFKLVLEKAGESESEVTQLCPTLGNPVDCRPPGSSVHGILQARILEWVAISFSRVSSRPRDRTQVSHIIGRRFNLWATREALKDIKYEIKNSKYEWWEAKVQLLELKTSST